MLLNEAYCITCMDTTMHGDGKCSRCIERARQKEEARWKRLSVEDKIEELSARISELEQHK